MALSAQKLSRNSNTANQLLLKPPALVDFLTLCGQLLASGFTQNEIVLIANDLKVFNTEQIQIVEQQLQAGASFATALKPLIQSPNLMAQLQIAEGQDALSRCCLENANLLAEQQKQRRQLHGLLIYPMILFILLLGLTGFVRFFLQPQLTDLNGGQAVTPIAVQIVRVGGLILVTLILLVTLYYACLPKLARLRCQIRWPILGQLSRHYLTYVICTDLGHLRNSGRPLAEMLTLLRNLPGQSLQASLARQTQEKLLAGQSLKAILQAEPLLPAELNLLLGAHATAEIQAVELQTIARQNYQKLIQGLERLLDQVQPILFILIALFLGGTYLQILLPIYQIMKGF
ncbi:type II secretion system F family protein [Lapidilactobacillus wuchangensis]|uniref:type II secretion system F family protein n=1 Tax=Lapidilactobacillus wuchangensis TaxID=2486001 RepID=UPI000F7885EE|nr:type II secretion system F family protein [Lapidilactobacillus wuchangensis]